jgi:Tfp pilus assembly protein PilF
MAMWVRSAKAALMLVLGLAAGCATDWPFGRGPEHRQQPSATSWNVGAHANSNASSGGNGSVFWNTTHRGESGPTVTAAAAESLKSAVRQVGDKVSQTLEVKPKVLPANDPVSLSSRPERLSPELYVQSALWAEHQGAFAAAKQQYERALELEPKNPLSLAAFARFHDRQGHAEEAERIYRQAIRIAPQNAVLRNDLGLFHARRGNLSESLTSMREAVRLAPHNARYRNNLAAALVQAEQPAEAVTMLKAVYPPAVAHYNVGCLLYLRNEVERARGHLGQAIQFDPSLAVAQQMLDRLESTSGDGQPALTAPAQQLGTFDQLAEDSQQAVGADPASRWSLSPASSAPDSEYSLDREPFERPRKLPPVD